MCIITCTHACKTHKLSWYPPILFSKHHTWETNQGSWPIQNCSRTNMEKNKQKINFFRNWICRCERSQRTYLYYQFCYRHLHVSCRWWNLLNLACAVVTTPNVTPTIRFPPYIWVFSFYYQLIKLNCYKNEIVSSFKMSHLTENTTSAASWFDTYIGGIGAERRPCG